MPVETPTGAMQSLGVARELKDVTVAILAGGLGSRLRFVVTDRPKPLADVRGRPFLSYLFDQLLAAGTQDIVLCTGYRGDQIRIKFGQSYDRLRLRYSQEPTPVGTAGALRLALPLFNSDPVLVMNGDSYCDANFTEFWLWHTRRHSNATLLLTQICDSERFGQVQIHPDGNVTAFVEKGNGPSPGLINAGIYLIHRHLLKEIPPNRAVSLERQVFPTWIGRGLFGFPSEARFVDIGTPEAYASAEAFFAIDLRR
jgi:D-glycero-alpha-D-manno-heptose 1-phosphate guanylyltransferase